MDDIALKTWCEWLEVIDDVQWCSYQPADAIIVNLDLEVYTYFTLCRENGELNGDCQTEGDGMWLICLAYKISFVWFTLRGSGATKWSQCLLQRPTLQYKLIFIYLVIIN